MTYRRPREGEALDATTLEADLVTALEDLTNQVFAASLVRRALRRDHVPGPITPDFDYDPVTREGLSTMGAVALAAFNTEIAETSPSVYDWQEFSAALPKAPYGPAATWGTTGWRIVDGTAATSEYAAERRFPATDFSEHRLLVNFSADFSEVGGPPENGTANNTNEAALVAIGIEDDGGRRYVILRSIRAFSRESFKGGDIGTFTVLNEQDVADLETHHQLTPGSATVVAAFAVISCQYFKGYYTEPFAASDGTNLNGRVNQPGVTIGNYNFDILPIPVGGI